MNEMVFSVAEFAEDMELKVFCEGRGSIKVDSSDVSRPGLQLAGHFDYFTFNRIQMLGNGEMHFILCMPPTMLQNRMEELCSYDIPCIVCSRGHVPPKELLEAAQKRGIPVLGSADTYTRVSHRITAYLDRRLAPTITRHGVLMDIYGAGVLITGESGTGKSETALEMIKSGHRLVADDVVDIRRIAERLLGSAPSLTQHLMEIRGIGIIDIRYMYGVGAVIKEKFIDLIIELEMWQENKMYDRLGLDVEYTKILDVKLPRVVVPVRPGRNISIVIEVAARNFLLKRLGYDAAKEFDRRWNEETGKTLI